MADFGKGGGEWNVNVPSGDDIVISWDVLDENGAAYDWTGATVRAPIDNDALAEWTVDSTVNGTLAVALTHTQTYALGEQTFEQYLRVTKGGVTSTWLAGLLKVRPPGEPLVQQGQQRTIRVAIANVGTLRLQGCVGGTISIGGGGGAPTGPAGGVLGGTYPNPDFAQNMATQTELNSLASTVDALALDVANGSPPSGAAGGVLSGTYPNPGFQTPMATAAALTSGLATKANTTHTHAAADVTSGQFLAARLGTGAANSSTILHGDGVYRSLSSSGGGSNMSTPKQSNSMATTTTSMTDLPGLAVSLISGHRYYFHFMGKVQSVALTTGARLGFSGPAVTSFIGRVEIDQAQGGVSHLFTNSTTTLTDSIGSLSVDTINTDVAWSFKGVIQPSADGVLQLRGATEVSGSQVTFAGGGMGYIIDADFSGAPAVFQAISTFTGSMTATVSGTAASTMQAPLGSLVAAATAVVAHPATMARAAQSVVSVMTATITTPPTQAIWETFELGQNGDPMTTNTVTANAITNPNAGTLTFSSDWSLGGDGISLHVLGHDAETLDYDRPTHVLHYGKWYHRAQGAPSETAWTVYTDRTGAGGVGFRVGITTLNRLIIQDGTAGATDTANFSFVVGSYYKFDCTANASGQVKIAIFDEAGINGTTDGQATDVITITTTAADFIDSHVGLNVSITGGGTTIPANLTDEPFDGTNGAQINATNTTADSHSGNGSCFFSTTSPVEGTSKCRINGTASDINVYLNPSHSFHGVSLYLDYVTGPSGTTQAWFHGARTGDNVAVAYQLGIDITGHLILRNAANGTVGAGTAAVFGTAFSAARYRIEVSVDVGAGGVARTINAWTGATLNSTSNGDRWQTATITNALTASSLGREQTGVLATIDSTPDFSIDRFKSNDTAVPSPIGGGSGADYECYIEEFRVSSISMPPNLNINTGSDFSATLVPTVGALWGCSSPTLDQLGTDQNGINQWVTAGTNGNPRDYPDIVHFAYVSVGGRLNASHTAMLEPAGKNRAIGLMNWQFLSGGNTCLSVTNGSADTDAIQLGNSLAAYPHKIMLIPSHEFDNHGQRGNAGFTDAQYITAWRRLHDLIKAAAPNVIFVWGQTGSAGNAGNLAGEWWNSIYPGDAYVDWIGWDPYHQKPSATHNLEELVNNNIGNTANGYQGFYWWCQTYHPTRPIMLSEWGHWFEVPFGTANGVTGLTDADAADRISTYAEMAPDLPALKAFVHYNTHNQNDNCIQRPAPNERVLTKAAMKAAGSDPYFTVWQGEDP